ncbi:MAG: hypothetical protein KC535_05680, partial [Nanoarchaeota archaeon]|nr:hypothetical protein [Nanoarchaeota archaeon]
MKRRFLWYDLVALVLLLFGSFLIIGAHFFVQGPVYDTRYPGQVMKPFGTALYPLHVDGWNHLSQTKQLIEEKGYIGLNPQLGTEEGYTSYEKGYHVFLALVLLVTGISLTQLALVVPPLVFFLGAFTLYLFFSRALLKPVAGLFSIAGLSVLTNDIHVLGFWFLVPLNFSLLFISLTLVTLFLTPKTYRWYFSGFLFFLSLFIYPLVSVFLLLFNGLFFFFEYKKEIIHFLKRLTHYQKVILWIGISFLFLLAIGVVRRFLIFPENWVVFNGFYSLFSLIWWPLIPFAGVGLFFLYKNYGDLFFSFLLIMMFTFFNALVFSLHQIGILIPYQRMLYFAELFLVIL